MTENEKTTEVEPVEPAIEHEFEQDGDEINAEDLGEITEGELDSEGADDE